MDNQPQILEQNKQNRDYSKKAKKVQKHSISPTKKRAVEQNFNNIKKVNNENQIYEEEVESILRINSMKKSQFNKKIEKKNDYLKSSINVNSDLRSPQFFDKKNNNFKGNNFMNAKTTIKNDNNKNNINNILNPPKMINKKKVFNNNISAFNTDLGNKNKNNTKIDEPYKIIETKKEKNLEKEIEKNLEEEKEKNLEEEKEKNPEKDFQRKNTSKKSTSQSVSKNTEEPSPNRTLAKQFTFQSQIVLKNENHNAAFSLDKRKSLKNSVKESSSLKSSFKDSLKRINSLSKKSSNNNSVNSINNIIIPLLNRTKENNCFLNVIIQVLFHLGEFKKDLLENNEDLTKHSRTINEFYNLFKSYREEQVKNKESKNKNPIEPILSVNDLRNLLNEKYKCFRSGEPGDPMETIGYIFDLIHKIYNKKRHIDYKKVENCKCPIHQFFFLKLAEIISCPYCNVRKVQMFNKDCYMFNTLISEITNKLHGKNFNSYKSKIFLKLKEQNEIYENENKIKIPGCNCNNIRMSSYEKKIKLNGPSNTYLMINITWAQEFPNMVEILKAFTLIPISDSLENLFTFGEEIKPKINDIYYIKSIILYGIYHYVCILYIKDQKKWAIIDDKTIKFLYKYYDLIDSLLRNHLMPVGIIYSKDRNDEISENEKNSYTLNKDEYIKLYQFCKDVDLRRGLKVSDIILSKGSFNENNLNYLNNNYFYKSIIDFSPSNNDNFKNNSPLGGKMNEKNCMNSKTYIKPNNLLNINNNDNDKNINIFNKDNTAQQNESKTKTDIHRKPKILGDFSNNNMKGGILILSSSLNDNNENNDKSEQKKEETDLLDFGKNYYDN